MCDMEGVLCGVEPQEVMRNHLPHQLVVTSCHLLTNCLRVTVCRGPSLRSLPPRSAQLSG